MGQTLRDAQAPWDPHSQNQCQKGRSEKAPLLASTLARIGASCIARLDGAAVRRPTADNSLRGRTYAISAQHLFETYSRKRRRRKRRRNTRTRSNNSSPPRRPLPQTCSKITRDLLQVASWKFYVMFVCRPPKSAKVWPSAVDVAHLLADVGCRRAKIARAVLFEYCRSMLGEGTGAAESSAWGFRRRLRHHPSEYISGES